MRKLSCTKINSFIDDLNKRIIAFIILFIASTSQLLAQQSSTIIISGSVSDDSGGVIIGATILIDGTGNGATTDLNGLFSISAEIGNTLIVSCMGYSEQVLNVVSSRTQYNIVLEEDSYVMDDVVVIGYGEQRKETVVGAVVQMNAQEIVQTPVANLSNALNGRLPGVVTMQRSGEPGADDTEIYIRGQASLGGYDTAKPLILVDGVERAFSQIDANEIESMSILKDASATAVYGVRGANGVILVTTRRGSKGEPVVSMSYQYGLQSAISMPNTLGMVDYAELYQEAYYNDTQTEYGTGLLYYTDAQMSAIKRAAEGNGTVYENMLYPNSNWADALVRDYTPQMQANINVSGGTEDIRYFVSAGYLNQTSIFKEDEFDDYIVGEKNYSSNFTLDRYNFRTNLDIDVADNLLLKFNLGGRVEKKNSPVESAYKIMQLCTYGSTPLDAMYYDGQGFPANEGTSSVFANYLQGGFQDETNTTVESTAVLQYDLSNITKGLKAHANVSFDSYFGYMKVYSETPALYELDEHYDYPVYVEIVEAKPLSKSYEDYYNDNKLYIEAGLDYAKTIDDHAVTAMVLYNQQEYHVEAQTPYAYMGFVSRLTYGYKSKYLAELNAGYNGSENFAPGNRFGFFPAVSAGWVISEESFLKENVNWISWLKLRTSYGEVGNDQIGSDRFLYYSDYTQYTNSSGSSGYPTGYTFGNTYYYTPMITEGKLGNEDVTWERAKKFNVGVDFNLFDNRLALVADYFTEHRTDILVEQSGSTPSILGATLPAVNDGETKNRGYEIELTWRDKIGSDFNYWIKGNYCFARNEIITIDEPSTTPSWQQEAGFAIGQPLLYECIGFFSDWDDVNSSPDQTEVAGTYGPGDRKYADINDDGVINSLDMQRLESGNGVYTTVPEITYGFNLGFSYKGFDMSVLLNGVAHVSVQFSGQAVDEFNSNVQDFHLQRWSPFASAEENANATYPALHVSLSNREINRVGSSGELGSIFRADYLRLKNIEIGYTFSKSLIEFLNLSSVRVYVNANNLALLYDALKIVDPESSGGNGLFYPQMRVVNIGTNIKF